MLSTIDQGPQDYFNSWGIRNSALGSYSMIRFMPSMQLGVSAMAARILIPGTEEPIPVEVIT